MEQAVASKKGSERAKGEQDDVVVIRTTEERLEGKWLRMINCFCFLWRVHETFISQRPYGCLPFASLFSAAQRLIATEIYHKNVVPPNLWYYNAIAGGFKILQAVILFPLLDKITKDEWYWYTSVSSPRRIRQQVPTKQYHPATGPHQSSFALWFLSMRILQTRKPEDYCPTLSKSSPFPLCGSFRPIFSLVELSTCPTLSSPRHLFGTWSATKTPFDGPNTHFQHLSWKLLSLNKWESRMSICWWLYLFLWQSLSNVQLLTRQSMPRRALKTGLKIGDHFSWVGLDTWQDGLSSSPTSSL